MPKRISKTKRPTDVNRLARYLVDLSTAEPEQNTPAATKSEISKVMAEMGRRGGKIGGKRRLETLTAEERSDLASKAARQRWAKAKGNGKS